MVVVVRGGTWGGVVTRASRGGGVDLAGGGVLVGGASLGWPGGGARTDLVWSVEAA